MYVCTHLFTYIHVYIYYNICMYTYLRFQILLLLHSNKWSHPRYGTYLVLNISLLDIFVNDCTQYDLVRNMYLTL